MPRVKVAGKGVSAIENLFRFVEASVRNCNQIDLIVRDVPAATAFFRDVVGLTVRVEDARFAELDGGAITIMLSPNALVPVRETAGVMLHIQVDDFALISHQI